MSEISSPNDAIIAQLQKELDDVIDLSIEKHTAMYTSEEYKKCPSEFETRYSLRYRDEEYIGNFGMEKIFHKIIDICDKLNKYDLENQYYNTKIIMKYIPTILTILDSYTGKQIDFHTLHNLYQHAVNKGNYALVEFISNIFISNLINCINKKTEQYIFYTTLMFHQIILNNCPNLTHSKILSWAVRILRDSYHSFNYNTYPVVWVDQGINFYKTRCETNGKHESSFIHNLLNCKSIPKDIVKLVRLSLVENHLLIFYDKINILPYKLLYEVFGNDFQTKFRQYIHLVRDPNFKLESRLFDFDNLWSHYEKQITTDTKIFS